jgi:hypothetical protein
VSDGDLMIPELTMLISPAQASPAKAVAAKAMHRALATLDLNLLRMPVSLQFERSFSSAPLELQDQAASEFIILYIAFITPLPSPRIAKGRADYSAKPPFCADLLS